MSIIHDILLIIPFWRKRGGEEMRSINFEKTNRIILQSSNVIAQLQSTLPTRKQVGHATINNLPNNQFREAYAYCFANEYALFIVGRGEII